MASSAPMAQLSSGDIPQADRTEKVIELVVVAASNRPLSPENVGLSRRHTSYYSAAARAVGLLSDESKPTPLSADFPSLSPAERLRRMAEGLAASTVGRAWLAWAGVERLDQLEPESATEFLLERSGLSSSTAKRRARTLRCYLRDLRPHLEAMNQLGSPRELLLAIYAALDELRPIDRERASELQTEIEAKPLAALGMGDLRRVERVLRDLRTSPAKESVSDSVIDRDYGVFLDAIPRGRQLLADVESLASANSFEQLVESATRVFVDGLGYTKAYLDETDRTERAEFDRIARIGRFGEVEVVCTSLSRMNWYARFYEVIYRFHPYAIILSIEPEGQTTRFVYREGPARPPAYRVLSGRSTDWEPNDNLVVWAWRLHQLRPQLGEGPQALQTRVARALRDDPEIVAADWPSATLSAPIEQLPGVSWADAPVRAFSSFVQAGYGSEVRRRWGLEAVLRDRFPMAVGGADGPRLHCVGWTLGDPPPDAAECARRGLDRTRDVVLDLELRSTDQVSPMRVRTTLPEPDENGRFVFGGKSYAFSARVRADGRLEALTGVEDEPDEVAEEERPDDQELTAEVGEADELEAAPVDTPDQRRGFRGVSPRAFYEYAVSRKLAGLAYRLFRLRAQETPAAGDVMATILKVGRRHDHFPLAAWTVFRRFIAPGQEGSILTADSWTDAVRPPSWACLDRSAALPGYGFAPVAGARLHPTGSLCVPVRDGEGVRLELVEATAPEVNPRASDESPAAGLPLSWWVSPDLAPFAEAPAGNLTDVHAAVHSRPLRARVAMTRGDRRGAVIAADVPWQSVPPRVFQVQIPGSEDTEPELLVEVGEAVDGARPWLRAHRDTWRMPEWRPSPYRKLAHEILEVSRSQVGSALQTDFHLLERLPAEAHGVVTATSVEPIKGPGNVVRGWTARLELDGRAAPDVVLGPTGVSYPVIGTRERAAMPFDPEGHFAVLLLEPSCRVDNELRDGRSGDPLPAASVDGPCRVAVSEQSGPNLDLRVRALDGEWLPAEGRPVISERDRLRWVLSDDSVADHLAAPTPWTDAFEATVAAAALARTAGKLVDGEFPDPVRTQLHRVLPQPEQGAALRLPSQVLHPWRQSAAGALLGVTREELDVLIRKHGTSSVVEALLALAGTPRGR
jgi:hypothetical protein